MSEDRSCGGPPEAGGAVESGPPRESDGDPPARGPEPAEDADPLAGEPDAAGGRPEPHRGDGDLASGEPAVPCWPGYDRPLEDDLGFLTLAWALKPRPRVGLAAAIAGMIPGRAVGPAAG